MDFADAEIRSLLRTEMALTETDAAAAAKEARVDGGAAALDTWLAAADAEVGDEKHKNTTRAIRAWLRARSLATIKPEAKVEAEATVPEAKTEEAVAVARADAADDADADANPVPESAHEPPARGRAFRAHRPRAPRASSRDSQRTRVGEARGGEEAERARSRSSPQVRGVRHTQEGHLRHRLRAR